MKRSFKNVFLLALLLLNIISWLAVFSFSSPNLLSVQFLDVGQGDSIFIVTPQNHTILIDGGPSSIVLDRLARKMPFGDRSIDLIILTHADKDHLAGILAVLKSYRVENILWNGAINDTDLYEEWIKLLDKEGANVVFAKAGQRVNFITEGNIPAYIDIIYPVDSVFGQNKSGVANDFSVVGRLVFGSSSFLFTGDISSVQEKAMVDDQSLLDSDVLKVAHHGSKFSTHESFLAEVLPEFAVIQVGNNSYGHPTDEVLERLEKFGINVLRNDLNGDIKILSDGNNLKIKTQK